MILDFWKLRDILTSQNMIWLALEKPDMSTIDCHLDGFSYFSSIAYGIEFYLSTEQLECLGYSTTSESNPTKL